MSRPTENEVCLSSRRNSARIYADYNTDRFGLEPVFWFLYIIKETKTGYSPKRSV